MHPYSAVSMHSTMKGTPTHIRDWLMSLPPASHASPSALRERVLQRMTNAINGPPQSTPFAEFDPHSSCWRTRQGCLLEGTSDPFTENWPKAGTMLDGAAYLQPKLELPISVIGGGALPFGVPTPAAIDAIGGTINRSASPNAAVRPSLARMATGNLWPTPTALDGKGSGTDNSTPRDRLDYAAERGVTKTNQYPEPSAGGMLNPRWVEWLMGWPIGWTSLEPLEMDRFLQWLSQHGCD